ncbi:HTH-type transcriptional regulator immR [[Eubacterium] contortum]|uniref:HTH-type transcriptional regulator immR n=1 Tax=Faecalicatena contorta TaxID=39482 RepID=A0A174HQI3_9FIRM|nr:helix-turn-helix transcriptional regulator [Faecalicatena contorta]CUO75806.1 HTH-type transcriptional regulator immR [[Eubacterium] contortum] [Faecalicatena contorta]
MGYIKILRALREDNDYTQKQIAEILNIGQRTYADYELGKTRIPLDSIIRLAKYYDVDMSYICGVTSKKSKFPRD